MMAIEKEINECEERYRHLRTDRQNGSSHAIEIGWQDERNTTYGCYGYLISTRGVVLSASCLLERGGMPNIARIGGIDSLDISRVIPIDKVTIHPNYNPAKPKHNIAILKLESVVEPTESVFPTCLWQNVTHSPIKQRVLDFASKRYDPMHPMYKSDCEALLNGTFDEPETICMNPGITP
ncbi:serine protease snake-like [Anopheles merus]|uniref:serine protease snake-like n=1 Tax=Anopheles merus TaxID=30066 RepID=UPI001BE43251|nr:serine protease snake-like [Anopheles merus]